MLELPEYPVVCMAMAPILQYLLCFFVHGIAKCY